MRTPSLALLGTATVAALLSACGNRDAIWDSSPAGVAPLGLKNSVAIIDPTASRVLTATVEKDLTITPVSLPIRHGYTTSAITSDRSKLLILGRGDFPVRKPTDKSPALEVIRDATATGAAAMGNRYELSAPLSQLTVDPEGDFAVLSGSSQDTAFVENLNELSIVDLTVPATAGTTDATGTTTGANPTALTLRSYGSSPRSFTFTPTLDLPGGPRRLLAVLTDRDLGIIDLSAPALGDITVGLSTSTTKVTPVAVAVTDGDPASNTDARLAIRLANDPNVILVDLLAPLPDATAAHSFRPTPNSVFAGGVPSDVAFVNTDSGLRLGALVPAKNTLALIDPSTGLVSNVDLGASFTNLSIVTEEVTGSATGNDIALAWSPSSPNIAFISLGSTVGKPYGSVAPLVLAQPVRSVVDVPAGASGMHPIKILAGTDGRTFFVLDLEARTASPIVASSSNVALTVAPGGDRAWLVASGQASLASLDLTTLHPMNLPLSSPVDLAFDITRRDGHRALVAVQTSGDYGLTVLDGEDPQIAKATTYAGILLGGVP